jgi:hypothetical protein
MQIVSLFLALHHAGAIQETSSKYHGSLTITAFAAVSLFTALGAVPIARIHGASGADMSGHRVLEQGGGWLSNAPWRLG